MLVLPATDTFVVLGDLRPLQSMASYPSEVKTPESWKTFYPLSVTARGQEYHRKLIGPAGSNLAFREFRDQERQLLKIEVELFIKCWKLRPEYKPELRKCSVLSCEQG